MHVTVYSVSLSSCLGHSWVGICKEFYFSIFWRVILVGYYDKQLVLHFALFFVSTVLRPYQIWTYRFSLAFSTLHRSNEAARKYLEVKVLFSKVPFSFFVPILLGGNDFIFWHIKHRNGLEFWLHPTQLHTTWLSFK